MTSSSPPLLFDKIDSKSSKSKVNDKRLNFISNNEVIVYQLYESRLGVHCRNLPIQCITFYGPKSISYEHPFSFEIFVRYLKESFESLNTLIFDGADIEPVEFSLCNILQTTFKIQTLYITNTSPTKEFWRAIARNGFRFTWSLHTLVLKNVGLTNESLAYILNEIDVNERITTLDLSGNSALTFFPHKLLTTFPKLQYLYLDGVSFSRRECAFTIASISNCHSHLTIVSLRRIPILQTFSEKELTWFLSVIDIRETLSLFIL